MTYFIIIVLLIVIFVLLYLLIQQMNQTKELAVSVTPTEDADDKVTDVDDTETVVESKPSKAEIRQRRKLKRHLAEGNRSKNFRDKFNNFEFHSI